MTKLDKLIKCLLSRPKDFSWYQLTTLLKRLGFEELQGKGSRVKFYHADRNCLIQLHKPHPGNILKSYVIKEIINTLIEGQLI